jgi:hypothetical protein
MTAPKIDNSVIAAAAAAGVMPLVAQMLGNSPKVKDLIDELASIEAFAADAHKEVADRYSAFRVRIAEFLSERGLGQLVEDYQAATTEPEPVQVAGDPRREADIPQG